MHGPVLGAAGEEDAAHHPAGGPRAAAAQAPGPPALPNRQQYHIQSVCVCCVCIVFYLCACVCVCVLQTLAIILFNTDPYRIEQL